ncbi:MAG: HYExAFE family protein [Planctomycetes bacterium]|nr:HYExAFE family protein [Planctomycetota bacterium]
MAERRSHYELAFEALLNRRGTPFVAVEDVRHVVKGRLGAKTFDYVVYPSGGPAYLVEVKGRKLPAGVERSDARTNNWITRADLEGMQTWQEVFGAEYVTSFVFAFWLSGKERPGGAATMMNAEDRSVVPFAGRRYSFWLVRQADYARHQKQRSKRWDTLTIPTEDFRRISTRLQAVWPSAPC